MEIIVGIAAFIVALWQLNLQRKETIRNGKINTLVHISTLLKDKISFHSSIIESLKAQNKQWQGHAKVINEELRPLLNQGKTGSSLTFYAKKGRIFLEEQQ